LLTRSLSLEGGLEGWRERERERKTTTNKASSPFFSLSLFSFFFLFPFSLIPSLNGRHRRSGLLLEEHDVGSVDRAGEEELRMILKF